MIGKAKELVRQIMENESSGHGMDHINRVYDLAMKFSEAENCDKDLVALGALLHDVDDYKLFGEKNQKELTNVNMIIAKLGLNSEMKNKVLDIVSKIGYSKRLKGICPTTIEGKIVSDADMCDAIGAIGILRTHKYNLKHGKDFFDKQLFPQLNLTADEYIVKGPDSCVCHIFEKMLKLKDLMFTSAGKQEAEHRHNFVVSFLKQFFKEENATDWQKYLKEFLKD